MSPLSFDNGWMDRYADFCVNTVDEKVTTATRLLKFGPVTREIVVYLHGQCLHIG